MKPQRSNGFLFRIQNKQSYLGPCSYISINLHIYITIFLCIYRSFYKYICFFIYLYIKYMYLSIQLFCQSFCSLSFFYLSIFFSFLLSIFLHICLSCFLSLTFILFLSLPLSIIYPSISSFLLSCASVLKHISWPHLSAFYSA